jgi:hypothetical protein
VRTASALLLLAGWSGKAYNVDYDAVPQWVEKQCATNTIPDGERIFVFRWAPPRYAAIVRFQRFWPINEDNQPNLDGSCNRESVGVGERISGNNK